MRFGAWDILVHPRRLSRVGWIGADLSRLLEETLPAKDVVLERTVGSRFHDYLRVGEGTLLTYFLAVRAGRIRHVGQGIGRLELLLLRQQRDRVEQNAGEYEMARKPQIFM